MKERILITGSTGFIGNYLVDEAISRGYEVYAGIRKTSNISSLSNKNIRLIEIDFSYINKITEVLKSLEPIHYIIHNAGLTKSNSKEEFYRVNQHNTENFLKAIVNSHNIPTKFILISSLAAYGPAKKGEIINLLSKPAPLTHYGKSKLLAEKALTEQNICPYLIVRPTAVYGPGEKDIFLSFKIINAGFDFSIGSHEQQLTFIYVKDLVNAVYDLIKSQAINQSYFISENHVYSKNDMGNIVAKLLNKKVLKIAVPVIAIKSIAAILAAYSKFISHKPVALNFEKVKELVADNWVCDIQPLRDAIGFEAKYSLSSGLKETIEWYREYKWL
jgi:UDP-glucose 4-epimerase